MDHHSENTEDLMKALDQSASESRTVKLCVEILVKPDDDICYGGTRG